MSTPELSVEKTNRAWQATLDGQYQEALRYFDEILAHQPKMPEFNNRGTTRLMVGDAEGAYSDFLAARQRVPYRANPKVGVALWQQGKREAACEDWARELSRIRSREITHLRAPETGDFPPLLWWAPVTQDWRDGGKRR
jgi:hypothetical protein